MTKRSHRRNKPVASSHKTPTTELVSLVCLIDGESTENAFVVDIESNKTVSHLREKIWEKNSQIFKNIDAAELILWAVSIPIGDDSPQPNLEELNSGDKKKPFPGEEMQEAFPEPLPKKYIHVIVKPPTMYVILTVLSIRTFLLACI